MGGINLEQLMAQPTFGSHFKQWERVAKALEEQRMPPPKMKQPNEAERHAATAWVRAELLSYAKKHDGEPGRVTVRRLTSGEYAYSIEDLTGVDIETGIDSATDSVGGEGFTNFGDVQFMQDANMERFLEAAKIVANHAVIGSGPLQFYTDPGKTGFEMSAITRIRDIYQTAGFRTVSGEGGIPFGLEKYTKVFYAAWRYKNRAALGEPNADLKTIAAKEGVSARFLEHVWSVVNKPNLGYPLSEVATRWRNLPAAPAAAADVKKKCDELKTFLTTWPSWLFARGDVAAGGAGDESPLVFNDKSLAVKTSHHFVYNTGLRGPGPRTPVKGPTKMFLNVATVNPKRDGELPVVIWHNPTVAVRLPIDPKQTPPPTSTNAAQPVNVRRLPPAGPKQPLREMVTEESARKLNFGVSPDGTTIDSGDFASADSVSFEVTLPPGAVGIEFQVDAQVGKERDQVYRITLTDRADGGARGIPTRTLLGDPASAGYRKFRTGVDELATLLPPNSNGEPTPADKDPVPQPFDSTFNVPEHDDYVLKVKYIRDDKFIYEHMLDDATRVRLNQAWNDLEASFEYHDNYIALIAQHFKLDLQGKHVASLDKASIDAMPAEPRKYISALKAEYDRVQASQVTARRGHLEAPGAVR
jgi:hypothetical protein